MRYDDEKLRFAATDLSNFLACHHLTSLEIDRALGRKERPIRHNPIVDTLRERGLEHEAAYKDHLKGLGLKVEEVSEELPAEERQKQTEKLMAAGTDVIFQAVLTDDRWTGYFDFLQKVDRPSNLGVWSYEPVDTKLARETKGGTLLQLLVYADLLNQAQGVWPEHIHVVPPHTNFEPHTYRVDDYAAYYRLLKKNLVSFIEEKPATYPNPVSHCDICAWWPTCEERRRGDDHLSYVAGLSRAQQKTLTSFGLATLETFATATSIPKPERGSHKTLLRRQEQARVQLEGRRRDEPYYEILAPIDDNHGFRLLPEPCADDIFLDFEGYHFAEDGVQEYLTGYITWADGTEQYVPLWAFTLEEEKAAFEQFVDYALETIERNPKAHIYHFAPYEPAALKRLMGRFATRAQELDELLRGERFVDLHAVAKRGVRASVESYSIKNLEPFFDFARAQDLRDASQSRHMVEVALDAGLGKEEMADHIPIVEEYNREDCASTKLLQEWLEKLRAEAVQTGHEIPRREPKSGEATEKTKEQDDKAAKVKEDLIRGISLTPVERTPTQQANWVLGHLLDYHRREDKAAWWELFRLCELDPEKYFDERSAVAGLKFVTTVDQTKSGLPIDEFRFPRQEVHVRKGKKVFGIDAQPVGTVVDIDLQSRTLVIKKTGKTRDLHPDVVFAHEVVPGAPLRDSILRFAECVLITGFPNRPPYLAASELLLGRPPRTTVLTNRSNAQNTIDQACQLALAMDGEVLAIQGPPGTGKTFTAAQMIVQLVAAGKRVGVTAVSHKVIVNLLRACAEREPSLCCAHHNDPSPNDPPGIEFIPKKNGNRALQKLSEDKIQVLGGTVWLWASAGAQKSVDYLFIDEAGQMSLANALAAAPAARNLILLGDPQQLEQPMKASHPEGSDVSALEHLLGGHKTMPPEKGLFLPTTWRLHPKINEFTSEIYYERRLTTRPNLENQRIRGKSRFTGSGLRYVPVDHSANTSRAPEEINAIIDIVASLLTDGMRYQDADGKEKALTQEDILIVAPYNAQVSELGVFPDIAIGTVDKFQGQQAPIVIYSMTSSTPDDAPRGMGFLYDPHRLNVATSRARAMCILVGSPALFEPHCVTPVHMQMANGLCRYRELATEVDIHESDNRYRSMPHLRYLENGFEMLSSELVPFCVDTVKSTYGAAWNEKIHAALIGQNKKLEFSEIAVALTIMRPMWTDVFSRLFDKDAYQLIDTLFIAKHIPLERPITVIECRKALDAMIQLLTMPPLSATVTPGVVDRLRVMFDKLDVDSQ